MDNNSRNIKKYYELKNFEFRLFTFILLCGNLIEINKM